jgi:heme exporter protein D
VSWLTGHAGFVFAAYAITTLVLAGMTAAILLDGRRLKRRIAELEARGVRRRSAARQP